jgi:hypothetical protein
MSLRSASRCCSKYVFSRAGPMDALRCVDAIVALLPWVVWQFVFGANGGGDAIARRGGLLGFKGTPLSPTSRQSY